jgi:hypothetical protein
MKVLLFIMIVLATKFCPAQDSATAVYINETVRKIEAGVAGDIFEKKDTSIYDDNDSLQTGPALTVHTEFYTNPQTMLLDKIVEKSLYKKISTELIVYFLNNQPVLFTNRQWNGSAVHYDFDIYYMNGNTVFVVKRNQLAGTPDGDAYLKWCYDLRKEYFEIVQEYNQTFAKVNQGRLK